MKTEQKEIGGTVFENEKNAIVVLGSDGRFYRHTYHKGTAYGDLVAGDVVNIYYGEIEHNDIRVYGVDLVRSLV